MKGRIKTVEWERPGYTLIALPWCWGFRFAQAPTIWPEAVPLADGRHLPPGAMVTRICGKEKSAGFGDMHMKRGALRFEGTMTNEKGDLLVLFQHWQHGKREGDPLLYFGFSVHETTWFFTTPAIAGRMIRTSLCEFTT